MGEVFTAISCQSPLFTSSIGICMHRKHLQNTKINKRAKGLEKSEVDKEKVKLFCGCMQHVYFGMLLHLSALYAE